MKLLLDTHAFLWFVLNDSRLSATALSAITESTNDVLLSPASCWEIAIKVRLGKLSLTEDYLPFMENQIQQNDFQILPIELKHTAVVATLPLFHRDPFDRLLIAQLVEEKVPLVSGDTVFDPYGIHRIW